MTDQEIPTDTGQNDPPPGEVTARRRNLSAALAALLLALILACVWAGWRASGEESSAGTEAAQERDAALDAATDGLVAFHTVDHRRIRDEVDRWSELSTGQLHELVATGRKAVVSKVTRSRTVSSASVVRAALTSFDAEAGDARVVAVVSIRTRGRGDRETTRAAEFLCLVQRESGSWKLSAMQSMGGRS